MNKETLSIILSISSFVIAILSLYISYKSFARDDHKLIFEPYYIFEDYKGRESDDFENICLIIRNIGRRVAIIKKVALYIGNNNYDINYDKIPRLLPGDYTSKEFLEIVIKEPIVIYENEEFIVNFNSNEGVFLFIKDYLKKNGKKGLITVLDSRGKTNYVLIRPSMKIGYSF